MRSIFREAIEGYLRANGFRYVRRRAEPEKRDWRHPANMSLAFPEAGDAFVAVPKMQAMMGKPVSTITVTR